jgi:IstB-like ATP binding protein
MSRRRDLTAWSPSDVKKTGSAPCLIAPTTIALSRLDKYHLLILDDLAYVSKDQARPSVLFELIGTRYERRSMLITANPPFGEWGKVFPDQAMTLAAIDRLVHHTTILEMNVESHRSSKETDHQRFQHRWLRGTAALFAIAILLRHVPAARCAGFGIAGRITALPLCADVPSQSLRDQPRYRAQDLPPPCARSSGR